MCADVGADVGADVVADVVADVIVSSRVLDTGGSKVEEDGCTSLLAALAYADLFDYPLTLDELTRYQVGTFMSPSDIRLLLACDTELRARVDCTDGYYYLRGREACVQTRLERKPASEKLWHRAGVYARWLAHVPFLRMSAVTGSLSMDNVDYTAGRGDIDLLVVAEPGRVWICRRLLIICVRLARLLGDELCPNYIVSADRTAVDQRDFFTAHELAQMVPIVGPALHRKMLLANSWAFSYLPHGFSPVNLPFDKAPTKQRCKSLAERLLRGRLFDRWESWEMQRLSATSEEGDAEVEYSEEQCKGHTSRHREATMSRVPLQGSARRPRSPGQVGVFVRTLFPAPER